MIADFRWRFWLSAALTIPIPLLSPMIQHRLGLGDRWALRSFDLAFALSSIFFCWPFLTGPAGEIARRQPGMMTRIALAIVSVQPHRTRHPRARPAHDNFFDR